MSKPKKERAAPKHKKEKKQKIMGALECAKTWETVPDKDAREKAERACAAETRKTCTAAFQEQPLPPKLDRAKTKEWCITNNKGAVFPQTRTILTLRKCGGLPKNKMGACIKAQGDKRVEVAIFSKRKGQKGYERAEGQGLKIKLDRTDIISTGSTDSNTGLKGQPLNPESRYFKEPCNEKSTDGTVQLEFPTPEMAKKLGTSPGPHVRFCLANKQPGGLYKVGNLQEALDIIRAFKACHKTHSTKDCLDGKGGMNKTLVFGGKKRR